MCLSRHEVYPRPQKSLSARAFESLASLRITISQDRLMIVRSRVVTRCCTQCVVCAWYSVSRRTPGTRTYATFTGGVKPSLYGQPQPSTHPHLFEHPNELTPGIRAQEYALRRQRLMENLPDGSAVLAIAGKTKYMSKCESFE